MTTTYEYHYVSCPRCGAEIVCEPETGCVNRYAHENGVCGACEKKEE